MTVFEALPVVGGMLRVGIPAFRLSPEILEREIAFIKMALDAGPLEELVKKCGEGKQANGFTSFPQTEPSITFGKKQE